MQLAFILAEEVASSDPLGKLGINGLAFVSQLVSFLIVLIVLGKFVLPSIQKTLQQRQDLIRQGVENAERAKNDLKEASAQAEAILIQARRDAQETIERARKSAEQVARQIEEEARARSEQIKQQQVAAIRQEAARARQELSRDVINLAIDAAGKVISRSVDSKDNRRLVQEFVSASDQTRNN